MYLSPSLQKRVNQGALQFSPDLTAQHNTEAPTYIMNTRLDSWIQEHKEMTETLTHLNLHYLK
jgi:hypothetical protein